jgi:hypothetical protein
MRELDWSELAAMFVDGVDRAVAKLARQYPAQTFYALAVVDGYAEAEREIHPPLAATNSVEALRDMHPDADAHDFWGERWNPGDWRWRELFVAGRQLTARYAAITRAAGAGSVGGWQRVYARQDKAVAAACAELARRARIGAGGFAELRRAVDFVVYRADSSDDGPRIARRTIPRATFDRLFPTVGSPKRERAAIEALPQTDRIRYLISRFRKFEPPVDSQQATEELVAIGAPAVPALIAALDDSQDGWMAAMVLARMGAPAADSAIPALIAHARRKCGALMWSACALGRLGRLGDLMTLARRAATQEVAVEGLKTARPDSYSELDALLSRGDVNLNRLVAAALAPGNASYDKPDVDFDAIARATTSRYAIIRADAACRLGDFWDARSRARAAPILAGLLTDRSSEVRRLATHSLGWCKRHAKPELPRIRALLKDPVPAVRVAAQGAIQEITGRSR